MENLVEKSLFHIFGLWGLSKKRAGDERGLVEKKERRGTRSGCHISAVQLVPNNLVSP